MSSRAIIPFGRWQTGRNPRWATRDVCLSHSCKPPAEDGVGILAAPASSSPAGTSECLSETRHPFLAEARR